MNKLGGLSGGTALGAAGIAAIVFAAGLYFTGVIGPRETAMVDEQAEPAALLQPEIVEDAEPASEPEPAAEDVVVTSQILPDAPSIDTFRLEPDGSMLIAGQAVAGWNTEVILDGDVLGRVEPDDTGQFVAFLNAETSDQPRILSLVTRDPDSGVEVVSLDEIIIAPTMTPTETEVDTAAAEVPPEPEVTETTAETEPEPTASASTLAPSKADEGTAQASQTVLLSDEDGVRVLQSSDPSFASPDVMSSVALDAITYSEAGEVQLAGRGQGDGFVQIYLDNSKVTTSRIEGDGSWRTDLPEVDTGVYTLRVDETDAQGNVTSRVETPFKREDEEVISAASAAVEEQRVAAITVQPGSTLWAISRDRYGEGTLYVRVFEANRDRIRNPDLIYPGQVFNLPE